LLKELVVVADGTTVIDIADLSTGTNTGTGNNGTATDVTQVNIMLYPHSSDAVILDSGKTLQEAVDDGDFSFEVISAAVSDETTDLSTGTSVLTFRMPYAMTLEDVRASVGTAPTGSTLIVDINESGTTVLSTKLSIDSGEKTSTTATTPVVISDSSLADDAEITVDIDQVGATVAGAGLKIYLIGIKV
jgi:hypothetical protein